MDRSATRTALLALTTSAVLFGVGCMSDVVDPDDSGEDTAALEAGARGLAGQQGQVSQTPQHKAGKAPKAQPRTLAPTQRKAAGGGEKTGQAGQKLESWWGYPGFGYGFGGFGYPGYGFGGFGYPGYGFGGFGYPGYGFGGFSSYGFGFRRWGYGGFGGWW
jgi:hypothetical protein